MKRTLNPAIDGGTFFIQVDTALDAYESARIQLNATKEALRVLFAEIVATEIFPGALVETHDDRFTENSLGYMATASRGRPYGSLFRIEGSVHIQVDASHPALSGWSATAISIKVVKGERKPIGSPFTLSGKIFPYLVFHPGATRGRDKAGILSIVWNLAPIREEDDQTEEMSTWEITKDGVKCHTRDLDKEGN